MVIARLDIVTCPAFPEKFTRETKTLHHFYKHFSLSICLCCVHWSCNFAWLRTSGKSEIIISLWTPWPGQYFLHFRCAFFLRFQESGVYDKLFKSPRQSEVKPLIPAEETTEPAHPSAIGFLQALRIPVEIFGSFGLLVKKSTTFIV